ncbi:Uncharacterized protein Fot_42177 [Forsythia ovata]|uniref:Uncharacterized protein n=1 Tax=Forsythia ovata TaxID=205694 RepID=A0ABD1RKE6_9LAMI
MIDEANDVGCIAEATNSSTQRLISSNVKWVLFESPSGSSSNKRPIEEHAHAETNALPRTTAPSRNRTLHAEVASPAMPVLCQLGCAPGGEDPVQGLNGDYGDKSITDEKNKPSSYTPSSYTRSNKATILPLSHICLCLLHYFLAISPSPTQ